MKITDYDFLDKDKYCLFGLDKFINTIKSYNIDFNESINKCL